MPNTLSQTWVKNVYSLGIDTRTTRVRSYTGSLLTQSFTHHPVHKHPVIQRLVPAFYAQLSPSKKSVFNLLYRYLYPQSTYPTIKTKKEK